MITLNRSVIVTLLALSLPVGLSCSASANELTLTRLVKEVKVALLKVEQSAAKFNLPSLKEATLTVNSALEQKAGGKVEFYVVSVGANARNQLTNTIELVLTPPPADSASDVSDSSLADALADSILAAGIAIKAANKGKPPLILRKLTATIVFAVSKEGGGGFKITFPPFLIDGSAEVANSNSQSIKIVFEEIGK